MFKLTLKLGGDDLPLIKISCHWFPVVCFSLNWFCKLIFLKNWFIDITCIHASYMEIFQLIQEPTLSRFYSFNFSPSFFCLKKPSVNDHFPLNIYKKSKINFLIYLLCPVVHFGVIFQHYILQYGFQLTGSILVFMPHQLAHYCLALWHARHKLEALLSNILISVDLVFMNVLWWS